MANEVKISIVTAVWNCEKTLSDCFKSIGRQEYANYEHIIIDGASTDDTIDIVRQHINQISIFKSEPDRGIYDALNKGIKLSTGDVVGFLHADDYFASDDVLWKVAQIFKDPLICAVYGDLEYVSQHDTAKVIRRWQSKPFVSQCLSWGWMPPHPTLFVRREWYSKIGGFDPSYRISADYLSILKLFQHKDFISVYLPMVLVRMRLGGSSNKSIGAILHKSKEDWRALRECGLSVKNAFKAIFWKNISKIRQFYV